MSEPLWQPDDSSQHTHLAAFWQQARTNSGLPLTDYQALHRWSVEQPDAFWQQVWDHCGVVGDPGNVIGLSLPGVRELLAELGLSWVALTGPVPGQE